MTTYLLDTSVIIDVLNNKRNRTELLKQLLTDGHLLACCGINIVEIYAGMRRSEQIPTAKLLNSLRYYQVTREVATEAGLLKRTFSEKGITLSVSDVTIAAVVLANNLTLITDNQKHYPMREIRLLDI